MDKEDGEGERQSEGQAGCGFNILASERELLKQHLLMQRIATNSRATW